MVSSICFGGARCAFVRAWLIVAFVAVLSKAKADDCAIVMVTI